MSTVEIKERIIDYIDQADDKVLEAIYTLLEANVYDHEVTKEQINIAQQRMERYLSGKSEAFDWEDIKTEIRKKA